MTEKINPSAAKFYLAEDIRSEVDGKQSVLGLYPYDMVALGLVPGTPEPSAETPIVFEGLCILCVFNDTFGEYSLDLTLKAPNDAILAHSTGTKAVAKTRGTMSFAIKLRPISLPMFGRYSYVLHLDGKPFEYFFDVTRAVVDGALTNDGKLPASTTA